MVKVICHKQKIVPCTISIRTPFLLSEIIIGPAHEILVLIASASSDHSGESLHDLHMHRLDSLRCSHTQSMDTDED